MGAFNVLLLHHFHPVEDNLLADERRNWEGAKNVSQSGSSFGLGKPDNFFYGFPE